MKPLAWLLRWILKAAVFFTLFAFALNNQHEVQVHFFFGRQWSGPLVLVVLSAFAAGLLVGVLGMVPRWWQHRKAALLARKNAPATATGSAPSGPNLPPEKRALAPSPTPPYGN